MDVIWDDIEKGTLGIAALPPRKEPVMPAFYLNLFGEHLLSVTLNF